MNRREFIVGAGAFSLAEGVVGCRSLAVPAFDENLTVFLSDIHVCGNDGLTRWLYTRDELRKRVAEILAMCPLPRRVVCFGDLSFGRGDLCDYRLAADLMAPLGAAGIRVIHAMGNHDCRPHYLDVFKGADRDSPVPGRIVSEIDLGTCDLILLDSLQGDNPDGCGACAGELTKPEQDYIADTFPRRTRPFLVGAHHSAYELKVGDRSIISALKNAPACVGWINGHDHNWRKDSLVSWGDRNEDTIRLLTLPSAGLWGDIGLVTFRTEADHATARLVQHDYWFNDILHPGEAKPQTWKDIIAENQGQSCRFSYERPWRNPRG